MYMNIILTALELGLISGITTLALFLSYEQLNVCDLSTDGCFTLGAVVGVSVALSGHPHLAFFAAIIAGMISGFVVAILQTYMGIDSLLSGIVVNTGLYSINIAIMEGSSILNMNRVPSIFIQAREFFSPMPFREFYRVIVIFIVVAILIFFISKFLKTKLGLAIRATGNNKDMVKASSVNPYMTTIVGLVIANAFTALSGSILAELQKGVNIDIGTGQVTIALASLLIGRTFIRKGSITIRAIGAVIGSIIFRIIYTIALKFRMPAYMLKLVSSIIVIIALTAPYLKSKMAYLNRRFLNVKS